MQRMSTRVDLPIEGMTCASCATRIGRGLGRLAGVERADVNLAAQRATVVFDADEVGVDDFRAKVESLGYKVPEVEDADSETRQLSALGRRLALAVVLTVPVLAISMIPALMFDGWQWWAFALSTPVVLYAGAPFHRATLVNLRHGAATMDTLVSMGTLAAWSWSTFALFFRGAADTGMDTDAPHVYFETAAVIVTLILLGRWLEARARRRSGDALRSLAELGVKTATLEDGRELPLDELEVGMRFVVRPGAKVATDGLVVDGHSAIDMAMITGEPVPVEVGPGDEVIGATVNSNGHLVVEATRVGGETALAQIVRLVEQAQGSRAPVQRLADRIAGVFVPVVLVIALGTLAVWLLTGHSTNDAFTAAVAVLIIACPCALGLATPTAIMVGTGRGAQLGIVIKGGEVLEHTRQVDVAVLDKTGTITEGRMELVDVLATDGVDGQVMLRRAASLESRSEHPIAQAIAARAGSLLPVSEFENLPGRGVRGRVDDVTAFVGRRSLFAAIPPDIEAAAGAAEAAGRTAVLAGWASGADGDPTATGVFVVADRVKPSSREGIAQLRQLGLDVVLLTGDNERTARAVAAEVGITTVRAEVLPADKVDEVARACKPRASRSPWSATASTTHRHWPKPTWA